MKKLLTMLLCLAMAFACTFGVAACTPDDDKDDTGIVTPGDDDQTPGGNEQPGGDEETPGGNEQPGGDDQTPGGNEQPGGEQPGGDPEPEPALPASEGLEFEYISEENADDDMNEVYGGSSYPFYAFVGMGTCTDTDIVIPLEYNGLPVRAATLDDMSKSVTSLYFPDSIVAISTQEPKALTLPFLKDIRLPHNQDTLVQVVWENCAFYQDPDNWENGALYMDDWLLATNEDLPVDYTVKTGTYGIAAMAFLDYIDFDDLEPSTSYRSHVQRVVLPDSIKAFAGAFGTCFSLKEVVLPASLTKISIGAFGACIALENITLPNSVTSIGMLAFSECIGLTHIDIPDDVTNIGLAAFAGCINLTNIEIPKGVTYIAKQAFQQCYSLTSITIPDSVTTIGDAAFAGSSLTSIVIPVSVTSIGYQAFDDCSNLTTVYYTGSKAEWEQIEISDWNDDLLNVEIVFNYKGE